MRQKRKRGFGRKQGRKRWRARSGRKWANCKNASKSAEGTCHSVGWKREREEKEEKRGGGCEEKSVGHRKERQTLLARLLSPPPHGERRCPSPQQASERMDFARLQRESLQERREERRMREGNEILE